MLQLRSSSDRFSTSASSRPFGETTQDSSLIGPSESEGGFRPDTVWVTARLNTAASRLRVFTLDWSRARRGGSGRARRGSHCRFRNPFTSSHNMNCGNQPVLDRKSTRLNSSHPSISYAVFCLKKKKQKNRAPQ